MVSKLEMISSKTNVSSVIIIIAELSFFGMKSWSDMTPRNGFFSAKEVTHLFVGLFC